MLKILFAILKMFPQGLALLDDYFAAERAELKRQVDDWQKEANGFTKIALRHQAEAEKYQHDAYLLANESIQIAAKLKERDAEIASLKNGTTKKLQAVDAMSSEDVFNASLIGSTAHQMPVNRVNPKD